MRLNRSEAERNAERDKILKLVAKANVVFDGKIYTASASYYGELIERFGTNEIAARTALEETMKRKFRNGSHTRRVGWKAVVGDHRG